MKCFILGAGASAGHNPNKESILCPPKSHEFFTKGKEYGLLDSEMFPDLYQKVRYYAKRNGGLDFDIEDFLSGLKKKVSAI